MPLLLFLVLDLAVTKSRRPCVVMDVALNDFDDTKRGPWNILGEKSVYRAE